jgi:hypothetical protein
LPRQRKCAYSFGRTVAVAEVSLTQYSLSIYLKEGRYKYVLSNLTHGSPGGGQDVAAAGPLEQANVPLIPMGGKRYWNQVRKQADTSAKKLVADLQNAMKGPTKDPRDF